MNYKDFYKKEAVLAKLKDAPALSNVDPEELKIGTAHEKEHTNDEAAAAVIAKQHLAEDPHYYSKMKKAGIDECGCGDVDPNGGLPKLGGALAIPHVGQPIHLSKIIQVGRELGGGPATGELSGFTAVEKAGVAKDKGGVKVGTDQEPITAGGKAVAADLATKSVGGPVTPGEGQKQGGPNSQGTIAATAKLNEAGKKDEPETIDLQESHKNAIKNIVKQVLKEIKFNKATGKWEKINENAEPVDIQQRNFGASHGGIEPNLFQQDEELNMKMGPSYKGPAGRQYRTSDDDQARQVEYEPEITERYDEEEHNKMRERYMELVKSPRSLSESEYGIMKSLKEKLAEMDERKEKWMKDIDPSHKGYCTPMTKSTCTPRRKAFAKRAKAGEFSENTVDMKMGPSYKTVPPTLAKTSEDDHARNVQFQPDMNEIGGMEVQHKSYRTANDAPQDPKNRHRGDIDETAQKKSVSESMVGDEYGDPDLGGFVSAGLKKLFTYTGHSEVSYEEVEDVGLGHIKDVDKAGEYALNLAREMAPDYNWVDDEKHERFITKERAHNRMLNQKGDHWLEETEKKSGVLKTIQRGTKAKSSAPKQKLTYKAPKKTKSGVHKKNV